MRAEETFDKAGSLPDFPCHEDGKGYLVTEACMNMNAEQTCKLFEEENIAGPEYGFTDKLYKIKMVRNKKVPRGHYRIAFTTLPVSLLSLIKYISFTIKPGSHSLADCTWLSTKRLFQDFSGSPTPSVNNSLRPAPGVESESGGYSAALTPSSVTTVVEADAQAMGESYAGFKLTSGEAR